MDQSNGDTNVPSGSAAPSLPLSFLASRRHSLSELSTCRVALLQRYEPPSPAATTQVEPSTTNSGTIGQLSSQHYSSGTPWSPSHSTSATPHPSHPSVSGIQSGSSDATRHHNHSSVTLQHAHSVSNLNTAHTRD